MRRTALRVFYDGAGLLIFAVMIFPIYWMVTTALKPGKEILSLDPYWFPAPVTFENFISAMQVPFFWNDVVNSLTVVLTVVAISRRILEQRFKRALGRSPAAEIRRVRLARATELLASTDWPISRVARASGFAHVEGMNRVFKRELRQTPSEYRNQ